MGTITFDNEGKPDFKDADFTEENYWKHIANCVVEGSSNLKRNDFPEPYKHFFDEAVGEMEDTARRLIVAAPHIEYDRIDGPIEDDDFEEGVRLIYIVEVQSRFGDRVSYEGPFSNLKAAQKCAETWMDYSCHNRFKIRVTRVFDEFEKDPNDDGYNYTIEHAKIIVWDDGREAGDRLFDDNPDEVEE